MVTPQLIGERPIKGASRRGRGVPDSKSGIACYERRQAMPVRTEPDFVGRPTGNAQPQCSLSGGHFPGLHRRVRTGDRHTQTVGTDLANSLPVAGSQKLRRESSPAEARYRSFGQNAIRNLPCRWPCSSCTSSPVTQSQTLTVPSPSAEARRVPSGLYAKSSGSPRPFFKAGADFLVEMSPGRTATTYLGCRQWPVSRQPSLIMNER